MVNLTSSSITAGAACLCGDSGGALEVAKSVALFWYVPLLHTMNDRRKARAMFVGPPRHPAQRNGLSRLPRRVSGGAANPGTCDGRRDGVGRAPCGRAEHAGAADHAREMSRTEVLHKPKPSVIGSRSVPLLRKACVGCWHKTKVQSRAKKGVGVREDRVGTRIRSVPLH